MTRAMEAGAMAFGAGLCGLACGAALALYVGWRYWREGAK